MSRILASALVLALLAACGGAGQSSVGGGNTGDVASITLTPASPTIQVGQTQVFTAVAEDASGDPVSVSFSWASSNTSVATISGGVASAKVAGESQITSSAGGVTSNVATLTVTAAGGGGTAPPEHDTIAYATGDGDAIRLVDPDGSNDRPLWSHDQGDPEGVYEVWSMRWKRDATELAFASTHESHCSLFAADIFTVGADGAGYGRVTQAPACTDLASYPTGTVRVPVENNSFESFSGFLYFQGAPSVQPVNLPPNGSTVVTFENVADFGDGDDWLQVATVIVGSNRAILFATVVDVVAGGTVTTSEAAVYAPSGFWEVRSPTWRTDGSSIGFLLNFNSLWQLPPEPGPLAFGTGILAATADLPDFTDHLAWGPTTATASQLLYEGTEAFDSTSIYLVSEGSSTAGIPLLSFTSTESVKGIAWLPDGSGFVFSVTEGEYFGADRSANLFHYDLASEATARITSFVGDFAGQPSVSPDGQRIVFERSADVEDFGGDLVDPDLWVVDLDGSNLQLLVADGRAPAWSW